MTRARANLVEDLLATAAAAGPSAFSVGTVTAVDAGAALDGNSLLTVDINGTVAYATYGDHYTPVVGHVVLLAKTQPRAVLIHLIGTPPTS